MFIMNTIYWWFHDQLDVEAQPVLHSVSGTNYNIWKPVFKETRLFDVSADFILRSTVKGRVAVVGAVKVGKTCDGKPSSSVILLA